MGDYATTADQHYAEQCRRGADLMATWAAEDIVAAEAEQIAKENAARANVRTSRLLDWIFGPVTR
jgi:hypothetical protein